MTAIAWFLSIVLVIPPQSPSDSATQSSAEDDIREVVLRKQMTDWAREGDKSSKEAKSESEKRIAVELNFATFFVSIEKNDPSDAFLRRFADLPRKVKPVSVSRVSEEMRMPVVDKETGRRAIVFYVDKIRWKSKTAAEVDGGYHCDGLCAAGITYILKLQNGKWTIVSEKTNWIS